MSDGCGTVHGYAWPPIVVPLAVDVRLLAMWRARESRISWLRDECDGYSYAHIRPEGSR